MVLIFIPYNGCENGGLTEREGWPFYALLSELILFYLKIS